MKTLVIGAGPTGLTAALALADKGFDCTIVERRTKPSELSRAVGIMPETIDKLRPLGAGQPIVDEGMALRKITIRRGTKKIISLDNTGTEFDHLSMIGLPQNRTEEIMRDALHGRGGKVRYGISVDTISTDDKAAQVAFSDGTTGQFDWVIAADGVHSVARTQLEIAYPGIDLTGEWSIADVDVKGDFDPGEVLIYLQGKGGSFGMALPIEKGRARLVSSTLDAIAAQPIPLEITKIHRTGTFPLSVRQAETYLKGRVLLAGDAAHCHTPVGGRGMNLGIDDAIAAVHAIVTGETDSYTQNRHKVGESVLAKSEAARKMIMAQSPLAKAGTSAMMHLISAFPAAHKLAMREMTRL